MTILFYDLDYNSVNEWLSNKYKWNTYTTILFYLGYVNKEKDKYKLFFRILKERNEEFTNFYNKPLFKLKLSGDVSYDTKRILITYEKLRLQVEFDEGIE